MRRRTRDGLGDRLWGLVKLTAEEREALLWLAYSSNPEDRKKFAGTPLTYE